MSYFASANGRADARRRTRSHLIGSLLVGCILAGFAIGVASMVGAI